MDFLQFCTLIGAALLLFFYATSHRCRYYVKFSYYYFTVILVSVICLFTNLLRPRHVENLSFNFFLWRWMWKLYGMKYTFRNMHYLKSEKPYVLVSNHQSELDLMAMALMRPWRCTMLAKKELLYAFPFGPAAWMAGLIYVDRLNPEKSRKTMEVTAKKITGDNTRLWVFPEGTRHLGEDLLSFKKGAFYLAVQAQVPIIPMVLSSYRPFLNKKEKIFNPGDVIMEVMPPISTVGLTIDDVPELTQKVYDLMNPVFHRLSKEVGPPITLKSQ